MALSGEPPEVVGPKLKQMQTISKGLGVPISDELINHYTNNSLSLGMSFDSDLLADLSPEEQRQLLPLIAQAQRPGPRQKELLDRLDGVRTVKLAQKITQKTSLAISNLGPDGIVLNTKEAPSGKPSLIITYR